MLKFLDFINEEQETDEAWSRLSRIKQGRNLKKRSARLKMGKMRQSRKIADPSRMKKRAQKQARAKVLAKLSKGMSKGDMTHQRKAEFEKRMAKPAIKGLIARQAKKLLPVLRKQEIAKKAGRKSAA